MVQPQKSSIRLMIFLAAVSIFLGGAGFSYLFFGVRAGLGDALIRIEAPGRQEILLEETGKYTVFFESPDLEQTKLIEFYASTSGLDFRVTGPDGRPLPVAAMGPDNSYRFGGLRGVSCFSFDVRTPGNYSVETSLAGAGTGSGAVLTLCRDYVDRFLAWPMLGLSWLLFTGSAAFALSVVAWLQWRKARRTSAL